MALLSEIRNIMQDESMERFLISFDNTQCWQVRFPSASFVEDAPLLCTDLEHFAAKTNQPAEVLMNIDLPDDYPKSPPFVRVVYPRFKQWTGHVTIGGSICTEILTTNGWANIGGIQLILILHNLLIDGNGRIDLQSPLLNAPYTFDEAVQAFNRVANDHGWSGLRRDSNTGRTSGEKASKVARKE